MAEEEKEDAFDDAFTERFFARYAPSPADIAKKQDTTIIYDGGYIRLTKEGLIEIENPQESLIQSMRIEKYEEDEKFCTFLIPHRMDVENLTKIYDAVVAADTTQKEVELETTIGLNPDGTVMDDGCFLHFSTLNDEGRQEIQSDNEKLKEHRILGKSRVHTDAVLNAVTETFDAIRNGLLEKAPDAQRRMMQNVGRDLQELYLREHGSQEQGRY